MAGFDDIVKKAFYMGVGFAAYAQEKAGDNLKDLKTQAQKLADEMIARGELNTKEARKFVDDLVDQAQQDAVGSTEKTETKEPRRIEIIDEEDNKSSEESGNVDDLRKQVESLQEELRRLKRDS
jgi:polyhydroxyalkanoate synthesis regulator phasin